MGKPIELTGQRFGRLVAVEQAENSRHGKAQWLCRCDCGGKCVILSAGLRLGTTQSCGCLQRELVAARMSGPRVPAEGIAYRTAHNRLRAARGPASSHACVDCDGMAREWSLRHDAGTRMTGDAGNGFVCAYSSEPADYEPRCVSCHRTYDWALRLGVTRTDEPGAES